MDKQYMNITQVAEFLALKVPTIKKYIKREMIPAYKVGGRWLFEKNEIISWVESRKRPAKY
ncbi:MAG: helix-turn-helix domain-containing protein [bacterium]